MGVAKTGLSVSTLEGGCAPSRLYELQSMPNKSQLNDFADLRKPSALATARKQQRLFEPEGPTTPL